MVRATVTSKGQVTLPKAVRDALGLKRASVIEFEVQGEEAVMRPAGGGFLARFGSIPPRRKPEKWQDVRSETRDSLVGDRRQKRK